MADLEQSPIAPQLLPNDRSVAVSDCAADTTEADIEGLFTGVGLPVQRVTKDEDEAGSFFVVFEESQMAQLAQAQCDGTTLKVRRCW
jgi:hypothetical protein